jgi:hypothetical protein
LTRGVAKRALLRQYKGGDRAGRRSERHHGHWGRAASCGRYAAPGPSTVRA